MRQGVFLNVSVEPQLIKSLNLANYTYKQWQKIFRNPLNNWRTGAKFQVLFNLATCSNYSTNYVKIPVFDFFEKVNKEHLKMVNVNY